LLRMISTMSGLVLWVSGTIAAETLPTFYFPEGESCTALVDFQKIRGDLTKKSEEERSQTIVRQLLTEFSANGVNKCGTAKQVRLMAVYIPGTDNYGRPDFPNRINILRLNGSATEMAAAAHQDWKTTKDLNPAIRIERFQ